jgi:hypothetical protein
VVQRKVAQASSAILAGVVVPDKNLAPAQARSWSGTLDEMRESDNRWAVNREGGGVDYLVVQFKHFGLAVQHKYKGASDVTYVQRLKVLV